MKDVIITLLDKEYMGPNMAAWYYHCYIETKICPPKDLLEDIVEKDSKSFYFVDGSILEQTLLGWRFPWKYPPF